MKEIQGTTGVHIVLDPQSGDLVETTACFDLRLPFSDLPSSHRQLGGLTSGLSLAQQQQGQSQGQYTSQGCFAPIGGGDTASAQGIPLITVRVTHATTGHSCDVSVAPSNAAAHGLSLGVASLLMIVDGKDGALSESDRSKLMRGEALVTTDYATGKAIVRVRPKVAGAGGSANSESHDLLGLYSDDGDGGSGGSFRVDASDFVPSGQAQGLGQEQRVHQQSIALAQAIHEGLKAADSQRLTGIAIVAPTGLAGTDESSHTIGNRILPLFSQ